MNVKGDRHWQKHLSFHSGWNGQPNCWMERAVTEIESRPYVERRGRHRAVITDECREIRTKLLRRRGSIMQRIGMLMEDPVNNLHKIIRLTEKLEKLKAEIEPYGGAPEGWK
jgi:hypothetical protein